MIGVGMRQGHIGDVRRPEAQVLQLGRKRAPHRPLAAELMHAPGKGGEPVAQARVPQQPIIAMTDEETGHGHDPGLSGMFARVGEDPHVVQGQGSAIKRVEAKVERRRLRHRWRCEGEQGGGGQAGEGEVFHQGVPERTTLYL